MLRDKMLDRRAALFLSVSGGAATLAGEALADPQGEVRRIIQS